jgi:hypothetical protein
MNNFVHFKIDDETQKKVDFMKEYANTKTRTKVFLWCLNKCFELYNKPK